MNRALARRRQIHILRMYVGSCDGAAPECVNIYTALGMIMLLRQIFLKIILEAQ